MLIREVILENFMSYEYAKVPLNSGLNIVCGPNGAGKSSILLAISVALGQAYTERGGKLSDLIRYGENAARVTLTFDNKLNDGARTIGKFDTDYVRLTRYLQNDGNYWFEINFQPITKGEVVSLLSELGINPDNMILIMHQHMMTEFSVTTSQQKLLMIEEAVGFNEYRDQVLEAQKKLTQVLSEEESISNILNNAEQSLAYWKDEYDKYQQKKELLIKKTFLERENVWAQLIKQEKIVDTWNKRNNEKNSELIKKNGKIEDNKSSIKKLEENIDIFRNEYLEHQNTLLMLEKDKIKTQQIILSLNKAISSDLIRQIQSMGTKGNQNFQEAISEHELYTLDEHLELIQNFNQRLIEFQTQTQLLKYEDDKLENAKIFLEKLMKDKKNKEKILQLDKEKLKQFLSITNQLELNLESLNKLKKQIILKETQKNNLGIGLEAILKGLPSTVRIGADDDSVDLKKELLNRLQTEIDAKKKKIELIDKTEKRVQFLTDEQQNIVSSIKVWENEIHKLSKQSNNIRLFIEGQGQEPQIKCDKCGSFLTQDQVTNHLKKIEEQIKATEKSLSASKNELKEIQESLTNEKNGLNTLHQEEEALKIIETTFTQTRKLLNDMTKSEKELEKYCDEQKEIIANLSGLVGVSETYSINTEQKAYEILNEIQTLKNRISQLEGELSNFEDQYIKPQRDTVETTKKSSKKYQETHLKIVEEFKLDLAKVNSQIKSISKKRFELDEMISTIRTELDTVEKKINTMTKQYQDEKAEELLLKTQNENIKNEIDKIEKELSRVHRELICLQELVEKRGPRIETERDPLEISSDIKTTNAHLMILSNVSKEIEDTYTSYLNLFNQLKKKVMIVSENREKTLVEVDERKDIWRQIFQDFLDEVNPTFQAFLEKVGATGLVTLVNTEDIQSAGIELIIGFKGAKPQVLDSHTHSGGERSTATMALLLALQSHTKSPFRAVDEFDVHMDPRNREMISLMLLAEMEKETENQYLTITPGQVTNIGDSVNVITVQSVQGKSEIKVMAG